MRRPSLRNGWQKRYKCTMDATNIWNCTAMDLNCDTIHFHCHYRLTFITPKALFPVTTLSVSLWYKRFWDQTFAFRRLSTMCAMDKVPKAMDCRSWHLPG